MRREEWIVRKEMQHHGCFVTNSLVSLLVISIDQVLERMNGYQYLKESDQI